MQPFERRGRWVVKVKRASGVWRQVTMPRGASLREAEQLQLNLELDALYVRLTGKARPIEPRPLRELAAWWETTPGAIALVDISSIRYRLRNWIVPALGDLMPAELTGDHVDALMAKAAERRSARTANHIHADVRRMLRAGIRARLWPGLDVTQEVDRLSLEQRPKETLGAREAGALLSGTSGRLQVWCALALYLALRKGECFGLHLVDVDLAARVLHVRHSHHRAATKNGRWRDVPIPRGLVPGQARWPAFPGWRSGRTHGPRLPAPRTRARGARATRHPHRDRCRAYRIPLATAHLEHAR